MMVSYPWREAPAAEFVVIGDPVAHSLSPHMHSAALAALGLPYRYVAVHVPEGEAVDALKHLAALGTLGVNATVPHKSAVLPFLRSMDPFVERVGACNTIRLSDRHGWNTDAPGFLQVLKELGIEPPARVLLLGAGGSARALLPVLLDSGYRVEIWNRTRDRATQLVRELGVEVPVHEEADARGMDAIVNTTSASLQQEAVPVQWGSKQIAIDLAYRAKLVLGAVAAEPTAFLQEAQRHGLSGIDGRSLLAAQGALSLSLWLGRPIDPSPMRLALGLSPSP